MKQKGTIPNWATRNKVNENWVIWNWSASNWVMCESPVCRKVAATWPRSVTCYLASQSTRLSDMPLTSPSVERWGQLWSLLSPAGVILILLRHLYLIDVLLLSSSFGTNVRMRYAADLTDRKRCVYKLIDSSVELILCRWFQQWRKVSTDLTSPVVKKRLCIHTYIQLIVKARKVSTGGQVASYLWVSDVSDTVCSWHLNG